MNSFQQSDISELKAAKSLLENPGLAARMADLIGKPLDAGLKALPPGWNEKAMDLARKALMKALNVAIRSLGRTGP